MMIIFRNIQDINDRMAAETQVGLVRNMCSKYITDTLEGDLLVPIQDIVKIENEDIKLFPQPFFEERKYAKKFSIEFSQCVLDLRKAVYEKIEKMALPKKSLQAFYEEGTVCWRAIKDNEYQLIYYVEYMQALKQRNAREFFIKFNKGRMPTV